MWRVVREYACEDLVVDIEDAGGGGAGDGDDVQGYWVFKTVEDENW